MDNCTIDCIEVIGNFSQQATCDFVKNQCHQDTIQIIQSYYCLVNSSLMILVLFSVIVMLLVYYAINLATDQFLAPCLEDFIVKLNMSQALAGITFLALANGAPDIVTAIVAGTSSSGSTVLIPFGSLYGAALFSMGLILSMVIYYSKGKQLTLNLRQTIPPLIFYIGGTLYLVIVSAFYKKMNIYLAAIFFSFYFMYFAVVVYQERRKKKLGAKPAVSQSSLLSEDKKGEDEKQDVLKKSFGDEMDEVYEDIHKKEEKKDAKQQKNLFGMFTHGIRVFWIFVFSHTIPIILKDNINNNKLLISLILSPVVLCVTDGIPDVFNKSLFDIPYAVWFCVPSVLLLIYLVFCLIRGRQPYYTTIFNIYAFVVIVVWITLIVGVLINLIELLQLLTNINSVFLGLTVLAWSGSIGDYLSITAFAKRGYSSTAVSAVFSGQLLNFLIGFGFACIINSITDGEHDFDLFSFEGTTYEIASDLIVMVVIGMAFLYMVAMIVTLVITGGHFGDKQRKMSRIYYIVFVLVALIISISTDFFREISCNL